MSDTPIDPADPQLLTGLSLSPERFAEVTAAFAEIRVEIDRLRTLDLGDTHPAVVFRPVITEQAK